MSQLGYDRSRPEYGKMVKRWNTVTKKDGVTLEGNNWILQSMDGFHDTTLQTSDYPDGVQGRVIVTTFTSELPVSKPPNLTAGGTWDFHLTTQPFYGGTASTGVDPLGFDPSINTAGALLGATATVRGSNLTLAQSDAICVPAPVIMDRRPSGQPTFTAAGSVAALNYGAIDIPAEYTRGPNRLVGMAVEVINTTAELYRNGSVTAYQAPSRPTKFSGNLLGTEPTGATVFTGATNNGATTANVNFETPVEVIAVASPPRSSGRSVLPSDSLEWMAADGGYLNAVFESPPSMLPPRAFWPCWYDTDPLQGNDATTFFGPWPSSVPAPGALTRRLVGNNMTFGTAVTGGTISSSWSWEPAMPRVSFAPISRKGLYFTGLTQETTLQVRVRFFIARVPSINEGQLFLLARPPPEVDRRVWELYTKVSSNVPCGCMFTANPLGEWFEDVLKTVADWAPTIGNAVGTVVPGASLLGQGIGKIAKVAHEVVKHPDKNEEHKKDLEIARLKQMIADERDKNATAAKSVKVVRAQNASLKKAKNKKS